MKKLIAIMAILTLVISISLIPVSAATTSLLPTDATAWKSFSAGDNNENVNVKIDNGATIVTSTGTTSWPCAALSLGKAESYTVPIEGTSFEYDFTVANGKSNIMLFFNGGTPDVVIGTDYARLVDCISNFGITDNSDVPVGTYTGTITLKDMTSSAGFPKTSINADKTVTISGIKIYSVGGAVVTVNKLQLVASSNVSTESSTPATVVSSTSTSNSSIATSSVSQVSNDSSKSSTTSSKPTVTSGTTSVTSNQSSGDVNNDNDIIWYIVIAVAVVAVIAVAIIAIKKKK